MTHDFDLVEIDRLETFAARIPNFTFSACVASPESQHPLKGYVTQHIEPKHLNDGDVDVYLCGPPPMVEAVSQFIREQGIKPANFYFEKFAASAA
ncbi:Benzoate 1,2-dioxygenase electron transfer component [compost metagenome]